MKTEPERQKTELAAFIQDWMERHNSNQAWVAEKAGLYPSVLSDIMLKGSTPRPATLRRIARAMGEPLSVLMMKAGYLSRRDVRLDVYEGLDDDVARALARLPREVQRTLVRDLLPAVERVATAVKASEESSRRRKALGERV